ncbi:MAG: MerR family transcriptional regulator [Ignavibacteria bacterium]
MKTEQFKLHQIEQLTGVKSHTIRMWEIRYGIFKSNRTAGNVRYYSDEELKKILNTVILVNQGIKISAVAKMNNFEIAKKVERLASSNNAFSNRDYFINLFIHSIINFNEQTFNETFKTLVTQIGFHSTIVDVVYPLLNRLGLLWSQSIIIPAHEHFASSIIRNKIIEATENLPVSIQAFPLVGLALPPDEYHEISLLYCRYLLKLNNVPTIYLGQSVPYRNLIEVYIKKRLKYILLILTLSLDINKFETNIKSILRKCPRMIVLVGGNSRVLNSLNFIHQRLKPIYSIEQFLEFIGKI